MGQRYAVLSYSGLGFGKTTCKIELDDPDWDGKAGKQMDDVLAGTRPYVDQATGKSQYLRSIAMEKPGDPRVGMIGGSYGGQIQYAVAGQDPRIDAIIPIITWNDLTYSLAPGNVAKKRVGRPVLRGRHRVRRRQTGRTTRRRSSASARTSPTRPAPEPPSCRRRATRARPRPRWPSTPPWPPT